MRSDNIKTIYFTHVPVSADVAIPISAVLDVLRDMDREWDTTRRLQEGDDADKN